ncbi:hypothetical protein Q4601_13775 [Shewanella sp. 1_MG-2023]|uniref:hypothetical protein n=1 Tax=unclassified Shewanella TaxID=196818 RepID=UPI0026E3336A|nr:MULTISPECIES: hypothetical protein [unclassified Shewanella]MDO6613367.1 hypothetical protein [Shewanella sp. 7_MG-2023]MDO6773175.1 hypothetical protein [Shewanella sp. 2_MG-2023]MDO6795377.1 hypothetical protein [Shewanella sp. 1_MG-2023]
MTHKHEPKLLTKELSTSSLAAVKDSASSKQDSAHANFNDAINLSESTNFNQSCSEDIQSHIIASDAVSQFVNDSDNIELSELNLPIAITSQNHNESLNFDEPFQLDESFKLDSKITRSNYSSAKDIGTVSKFKTIRKSLTLTVFMVAITHILAFFILLVLAEQTVNIFVEIATSKQENQTETKEINAYFITAEQLDGLINQDTSASDVNETQIDHTATEPQDNAITIQDAVKEEVIEERVDDATSVETKINTVNLPEMNSSDNQLIEVKEIYEINTIIETKEDFNWANIDSMYLQQEKDDDVSSHLFKDIKLNQHLFTGTNTVKHQVLKNLNQQALNTLISQQAHLATSKSGASLSELTPEMFDIEIIEIEDKRQATTLDHRLDPNRIMKHGETCYRIVPLPTQINPHAEGLGFAEPCDSAKMKKALSKAIQNRLSKVQLP